MKLSFLLNILFFTVKHPIKLVEALSASGNVKINECIICCLINLFRTKIYTLYERN